MDNNPDYSSLLRLARSQEGQQLMKLLNQADGSAMRQVTAAAADGDLSRAKSLLSTLLDSPEARDLLKKLEAQL